MKGVFLGSGSDGMQQPDVLKAFLSLVNKTNPSDVVVAYVGTPTYDLPGPKVNQTKSFSEAGCQIVSINMTSKATTPSPSEISTLMSKADICIISGGNTLYALRKWQEIGFDLELKKAAERGCVMGGGSAGAIVWFAAGHSDSADKATYRSAMCSSFSASEEQQPGTETWKYLRVACLNILPGLVCPHFDRVQSNGVLRAIDFEGMMKRHPSERGICIDHWAGLVVDGNDYKVLRCDGKEGSVASDGTFKPSDDGGLPGCWMRDVVDGEIVQSLVADSGKLDTLLKEPVGGVVEDVGCDIVALENPLD
jgi:dipeptidase E